MGETIYISRRCEHCHELLVKLHKNKETIRFSIVDIDTNSYPNIIQSVPCMVVDGRLLPGDELFKYIDYLLKENNNSQQNQYVNNTDDAQTNKRPHQQQQQQQQQQQHQQQQQQPQQQNDDQQNNSNEDDDLDGFCIGGMCDLGFSMLEETGNDNIQQDNYEYLNSDMKHTEKVIEESTKTDKSQEMDDDYARMMDMRGESSGGSQMNRRS